MTATLDFRQRGACLGMDPEFFFPGRGRTYELRDAQAVCATCPVREECAEWGTAHEAFGVWGGLSERARKAERKARGIELKTPTIEAACGTVAGYKLHLRTGSPACGRCRAANATGVAIRKEQLGAA